MKHVYSEQSRDACAPGWIRFYNAAAQLCLQRHDQAALCERFSTDGQIHNRYRLRTNYITPPHSVATGVEMELGLTVRNHLINLNATQSFYQSWNALLALFACCV